MRRPLTLLVAALTSLGLPGLAAAETYEDTRSGFSLDYPSGWLVADDEASEAIRQAGRELLGSAAGRSGSGYDVYIFDPATVEDESVVNINVISNSGTMKFTDEFVDELTTGISTQIESAGIELEGFDPELRKIGANNGLLFEYTARFPEQEVRSYTWQFFVAGREKYYILLCSVPAPLADAYQGICADVLESFDVDTGVEGFISSIPPIFRDGIQGLLVALFVGAFLSWRARRTGVEIGGPEPPPSIRPERRRAGRATIWRLNQSQRLTQ